MSVSVLHGRRAACVLVMLAGLLIGGGFAPTQAADASADQTPSGIETVSSGSATAEYFAQDGRTVLRRATYGPETAGATLGGTSDPLAASGSGGTSSSSGCIRVTVKNHESTTLGFTAYNFNTWTRWCWNRSTQTVYDVTKGWTISDVDPLFYWRGIVNSEFVFYDYSTNDGHPRSAYKNYQQGHFEDCVLKYGCIGQLYPTNTLRSYYNGTWAWTTSG